MIASVDSEKNGEKVNQKGQGASDVQVGARARQVGKGLIGRRKV